MSGPHGNNILPIICHGPLQAARCSSQWPSAHRSIISEEHGTGNNQDNELYTARDVGAVGGEDTRPPSPSSNEHAEEIEQNKANRKLVDSGDDTQTTAKFLAVGVTIVNDFNISLEGIEEDILFLEIPGVSGRCYDAKTPVNYAILRWVVIGNSSRLISSTSWIASILIVLNAFVPAATSIKVYIVNVSIKIAGKEIIGVKATSGIEPNDWWLMELLPVWVLIGAPANGVSLEFVLYRPLVIFPSLVALALSEVVIIVGVSLNTI